MAPIRRKRNVESSEEQVTNNEEQLQLDLVSENQEEKSETSNAVENQTTEESAEMTSNSEEEKSTTESENTNSESAENQRNHKERTVVRPKIKKRMPNRRDNSRQFNQNHENQQDNNANSIVEDDAARESKPRLSINELTKMGMHDLRALAERYGFTSDYLAPMKKQELIFIILNAKIRNHLAKFLKHQKQK